MDLPFLVVTSMSLQAAVIISTEMAMIHFGTVLCAILFCRFLPRWSRALVYPAIATLIMLGAELWLGGLFPMATGMVGMFIYLMAVNSMTFAAAMSVEPEDRIYPVVVRAIKSICGFVVCMFAVSLVREYLWLGSVWGRGLPHIITFDGAHMPFFGFILLGFLLAGGRVVGKVVQAVVMKDQLTMDN